MESFGTTWPHCHPAIAKGRCRHERVAPARRLKEGDAGRFAVGDVKPPDHDVESRHAPLKIGRELTPWNSSRKTKSPLLICPPEFPPRMAGVRPSRMISLKPNQNLWSGHECKKDWQV